MENADSTQTQSQAIERTVKKNENRPGRKPIRVLLVDDSLEFLDSATRFLSADPQIRIIGRALSGREALEQVELLRPDLVLMDLVMPEMSGLNATQAIKRGSDPPRVVVLSLYGNEEYRAVAKHVGADAFVAKSDFGAELRPLIHDLFDEPAASDELPGAVNEEDCGSTA